MKSIDNEILFICANKVDSVLVGTGIRIIFSLFLFSYLRSVKIKDKFFSYILLGFALTEAIALFALMMAFLILYT